MAQQPPTQITSSKTEEDTEINIRIEDPFDKVLLLKNIDNAILTSYRTLKAENNVMSETMKVVHQKFCHQPDYNLTRRKLAKLYRQAQT